VFEILPCESSIDVAKVKAAAAASSGGYGGAKAQTATEVIVDRVGYMKKCATDGSPEQADMKAIMEAFELEAFGYFSIIFG
jgi:hypothetical protein